MWVVIEGTARLTKHNRPGYDEELPGPSTIYKADHLNVAECLTLDNGHGLELYLSSCDCRPWMCSKPGQFPAQTFGGFECHPAAVANSSA